MDEQDDRIRLLLALLESRRSDNPALDLLLRAVEPELLSRVEGLALQSILGELRELLDLRLRHVHIRLGQPSDDEDVVGRRERATREEEAAVWQGLNAGHCTSGCKRVRSVVL